MQSDLELLSHAISLAPSDGLILEFGVASGRTIRHLAEGVGDRTVFGFDSFKGLPENWWSGFEKGHFSQRKPEVPENVHLIEGLFSETLPSFLAMHGESVALLHVDCDLYSSTKTILTLLAERIVSGTVIVFEVTDDFSLLGQSFVPLEQKGIRPEVTARTLKPAELRQSGRAWLRTQWSYCATYRHLPMHGAMGGLQTAPETRQP
jgi:hypothetical protein